MLVPSFFLCIRCVTATSHVSEIILNLFCVAIINQFVFPVLCLMEFMNNVVKKMSQIFVAKTP